MKITYVFISALILFSVSCKNENNKSESLNMKNQNKTIITTQVTDTLISSLVKKFGAAHELRIKKSIPQLVALWTEKDGSQDVFSEFCHNNFIASDDILEKTAKRLESNFESLYGYYNRISTDLKVPLHLEIGEVFPIDELFGGYEPFSHMTEDFFNNKIGFVVLLNFPYYSLAEKAEAASSWNRRQWAYARLGDIFASRIPSELLLKEGEAMSNADSYISNYNIYMGNLVDDQNKTLFPEDMKLITHWGLRDELKSNYSNKENGLVKQKMVYQVMKNIIAQTIPESVINSNKYKWNPFSN